MRHRLLMLLVLAVLGAVATTTSFSGASFSTSSHADLRASTDSVANWLRIDSADTDPDVSDRAGYARQYNDPALPFVASGDDMGMSIYWGEYPDSNTTYTFNRTFTLRTPASFPDPSVSAVTVTATYWIPPDQLQPLQSVRISAVGSSGGQTSVTLGPGQKRQVNVQLKAKRRWEVGEQYTAHIVLTVSYSGGPSAYYVYDVPTLVTVL